MDTTRALISLLTACECRRLVPRDARFAMRLAWVSRSPRKWGRTWERHRAGTVRLSLVFANKEGANVERLLPVNSPERELQPHLWATRAGIVARRQGHWQTWRLAAGWHR